MCLALGFFPPNGMVEDLLLSGEQQQRRYLQDDWDGSFGDHKPVLDKVHKDFVMHWLELLQKLHLLQLVQGIQTVSHADEVAVLRPVLLQSLQVKLLYRVDLGKPVL